MTRRTWMLRLLAVASAVTVGGLAWATSASHRADCPGKIVCPLTGELVCKDRCPLANHPTGDARTEVPECCRAKAAKQP